MLGCALEVLSADYGIWRQRLGRLRLLELVCWLRLPARPNWTMEVVGTRMAHLI